MMMMNVPINYLGVLLAAIASMVVGFIYYNPAVAGKPWMKAMGYTAESLKKAQKEMGKLYGLSFVLALVTAFALANVMFMSMNAFHYTKIMTGITSAILAWLGFIMPVQATGEIFGGKRWNLFWINTVYQLVALLVMGVVLAVV